MNGGLSAISTASSSSSRSCPEDLEQGDASVGEIVERTYEVLECFGAYIAPLPAVGSFEVVKAWYGTGTESGCKNTVVDYQLRKLWNPCLGISLPPYSFNSNFGDPAPGRMKKLHVEYRYTLSCDRKWDVSLGHYKEGAEKLTLFLPFCVKFVSNLAGCAVVAGGYSAGKAVTSWKSLLGSKNQGMADCAVFQKSINLWLLLNGITPAVTYLPLNDETTEMREIYRIPPRPLEDITQTPIIVANHTSYIDGLVLTSVFTPAPKLVAGIETGATPVVGRLVKDIGVIELDRWNEESRRAALGAIENHVRQWQVGDQPLLVFPEGTTTNGEGLLRFRKGAFTCGCPVRPVVLMYTGSWNPANVNFRRTSAGDIEPCSETEWYVQFFGNMIHSLQVKVLPPYYPNEEERMDPDLFAANVRALMAKVQAELQDHQNRSAEERGLSCPSCWVKRKLRH